jgi:hypothetical protein
MIDCITQELSDGTEVEWRPGETIREAESRVSADGRLIHTVIDEWTWVRKRITTLAEGDR